VTVSLQGSDGEDDRETKDENEENQSPSPLNKLTEFFLLLQCFKLIFYDNKLFFY